MDDNRTRLIPRFPHPAQRPAGPSSAHGAQKNLGYQKASRLDTTGPRPPHGMGRVQQPARPLPSTTLTGTGNAAPLAPRTDGLDMTSRVGLPLVSEGDQVTQSAPALAQVPSASPKKARRRRYAGNDAARTDPNRLLDEIAAAEMLGVSPATLRNMRSKSGGLGPKFVRISRRCIRYEYLEIQNFIASRRVNSTSEDHGDE